MSEAVTLAKAVAAEAVTVVGRKMRRNSPVRGSSPARKGSLVRRGSQCKLMCR